MVEIQAVGGYFERDAQGFIINPCRMDLVVSSILPILETIKTAYIRHLGSDLHAIYLRGSLPRGMATNTWADIDTFALIHRPNIRWQAATWTTDLEVQVERDFGVDIPIECMLSTYYPDFFQKDPKLAMLLKTQSLCIYGADISGEIPSFRPDESMCLNYRWLEEDAAAFFKKKEQTANDFQTIIKVILRTAHEIILSKSQKYTPDLYYCVESYLHYYPQYTDVLGRLLTCYLNPNEVNEADIVQIRQICAILVQQIEKEFDRFN